MRRCPIVIQTCDKYERFWEGLFRFMDRNWDPGIDFEIYFCNESSRVSLPRRFHHLPTGRGTFVENLKFILETLDEDHVFHILEDFWPMSPMNRELFHGLHKFFLEENADAVQVSSYLPYYSLEVTDRPGLFRFSRSSEWIFNFQARFWKTECLLNFLTEPEVSESEVGSAITVEMASDRKAREAGGISAFLYHYLWYPISGVSYRGELTEIGRQMQNVVDIDNLVQSMFSIRHASPSTLPLWIR